MMRTLFRVLVVPALLSFPALFSCPSAVGQTISTVAGGGTVYLPNNTQGAFSRLYGPTAVAVDSSNNLYFADCNPSSGYGAVIYKYNPSTGYINIVAGTGAGGYTGDGGAATQATLSNQVYGLAVAPSGNIYISDSGYAVIRKVTISAGSNTGTISTYAGYNPSHVLLFGGYNGDGISATSAYLHAPAGIYVTSSSLYIADLANHRVRMVNSSGIISTVAGNGTLGYAGDGGAATNAELVSPTGVSLNTTTGDIYISDEGQNNADSNIRKVSASTGNISTYAGGTGAGYAGDGNVATSAGISLPNGLSVDSSGDVYIADTMDMRIRDVSYPSQIIETVAGDGVAGFSGDGGSAKAAELYQPYGVAVDVSGNLYIADYRNARIRRVH